MANTSPFQKITRSRYTYAVLVLIVFLAAFIIEVQRTKRACKTSLKSGSIKTSEDCSALPEVKEYCHDTAFDASRRVVNTVSGGTLVISEIKLFCPWRVRTSVLNYTSIGAALVFLVFFTKVFKQLSPLPSVVFGFLAAALTLVSVILMAIDTSDGVNQAKIAEEQLGKNFKYSHGVFITNAVLSGVAFLLLSIFTFMAFREQMSGSSSKTAVVKIHHTPGDAKMNDNQNTTSRLERSGNQTTLRINN